MEKIIVKFACPITSLSKQVMYFHAYMTPRKHLICFSLLSILIFHRLKYENIISMINNVACKMFKDVLFKIYANETYDNIQCLACSFCFCLFLFVFTIWLCSHVIHFHSNAITYAQCGCQTTATFSIYRTDIRDLNFK